jgi:hypothetical protein
MTTSPVRHADLDAYRYWRNRQVGPAYLRGFPTWVWDTAMGTSRTRYRTPQRLA